MALQASVGGFNFLLSRDVGCFIFNPMLCSSIRSVHFVGICGTAMASAAAAMQEKEVQITGSDQNVYPPMSTFLADRKPPAFHHFHSAADSSCSGRPKPLSLAFLQRIARRSF